MTEPDQAVIARLSSDFASIAAYLARASVDLRQLERIVTERPSQPQAHPPPPAWPTAALRQPPGAPVEPVRWAPAPPVPPPTQSPRSDGWIGKALAVAGVAVTLVGVVLLLVLAAQAGILRPEFRVFAGAALAAGLVGAAWRLSRRPGGRVGAIALAATGIAAAYVDVIAVTTIYHYVSAPVGLAIAAAVALAGLMLSRRWNSEHLGLLVLVPLLGLAPVVADHSILALVGFMLALSAASVPVQLGRDWIGLHAARMAVSTLPVLVALALTYFSSEQSPLLAVACALAGVLAVSSALILLPHTRNSVAMGLLSAAGTMPVLAASLAVGGAVASLMAAVLSAVLMGIVLAGGRLSMVTTPVQTIWSALAAVAALIAVMVAFDGPVAGPVLLAMAVVAAVAGRRSRVARWCALGFGIIGGLFHLGYAPLSTLVMPTALRTPIAVSTLVASVLMVAVAVAIAWSWPRDWSWAAATLVALYGITMFAVTAGVLLGGEVQGFFAGHVAATICWIALAAAAFRYATRVPRAKRSLPLGGGMTLVAAAVAKLFLFDLGTLDGIFRVVVFIVVGLALLGMGAGYARLLAQQDERELRA
ncbi:DUF2339 domain-containing protein [Mycolicibacterium hodleri]|uniref:DUF2339 domain-containing protein n=1 Tax=Mycolicibacterium hodleri TaxID=49897 RepID=A0A502E5H2_9MYCO|nr:DUF2339 domain-containing protein [Mycolicibacterium hodleri]TPG32199.1 DUF2339 domain-containing protein [Mycolicibacterium hodleri]